MAKTKEKFRVSLTRYQLYEDIEDLLWSIYKEKHFWYWCVDKGLPSPCNWTVEKLKELVTKLERKKNETN